MVSQFEFSIFEHTVEFGHLPFFLHFFSRAIFFRFFHTFHILVFGVFECVFIYSFCRALQEVHYDSCQLN